MKNDIKKNLTILVVSDLHAVTDEERKSDSYLFYKDSKSSFEDDFLIYLRDLDKSIDVLVCPGDIANMADENAFELGWKFLHKIQKQLEIPVMLTVPGNHDHKSRKDEKLSPTHFLQYLTPQFPLDDYSQNTHFWAWNWIAENSNEYFNTVLLNTSAYHGYKKDGHDRGRVSHEACERIGDEVREFSNKVFNLLVCHHAPYKMEHAYNQEDNQEIQGAQNLIHILESNINSPWLVIHGHKHFAEIRYAISKRNAPTTLFSSGSLAAKSKTEKDNHFHIIEIDISETQNAGRIVGVVSNYQYKIGVGWDLSTSNLVPGVTGFGGDVRIPQLAKEIDKKVKGLPNGHWLEEIDLADVNKKLIHCTPQDIEHLSNLLEDCGFDVEIEGQKIIQVAKK